MAKLLKLRRGTTSQHSSFTGAEGEVTVDTTKDTVVVHDGSTAGGTPLAKEATVSAIPAVIDEDNMSSNSATRPPSQQSVKAYVDALPAVIDEDNFASNSATRPASQQSVKAYVDALPDVIDEDNFATNSATRPPSQQSVKALADTKAPLASPALTGTATGVNLTLSGELTVNGTTTTVATTNTTVTDNLLELNSGASSNANDAGIIIERGSTGDNAIIAWDESTDKFTVGTTTANNTATGNISITTGTLVANVEGNVTGDLNGTASSATNADTVDNLHAASFVRSDASDTLTGATYTFSSSTHEKIKLSGSVSPHIRFQESTTNKAYIQWNSGDNNLTIANDEDGARLRIKDSIDFSTDSGSSYNDILHQGNVGSGGSLSSTTVYTSAVHDSKGDVRKIIQNYQTSAYTLVAADAGKYVLISTGGVTANASIFGAGDAVTIINHSGSDQTITQGSGVTIYNTADAATGNRVLAARGMATILWTSGTVAYISGAGLS